MRLEFLGDINYSKLSFTYKYGDNYSSYLNEIDIKNILSNGHTARGILVYVLRNWLNQRKRYWKVEITSHGSLLLNNDSRNYYLFHAFNLDFNDKEIERIDEIIMETDIEEIEKIEKNIVQKKILEKIKHEYDEILESVYYREIIKVKECDISGHFCTILDYFDEYKKLPVYMLNR